MFESLMRAAALGVGATAIMDFWSIAQSRVFGVPFLGYRLIGRWVGHFRNRLFVHDNIGQAEPVDGEVALGWSVHYAVGILYAGVLLSIWGLDWLRHPTLAPALIVGLGSIVAPLLIMQPGLGAGIAASRTPKPWLARFRSLVAHTSFAIGLYLAALILGRMLAWPG